jgi:hypothetical protein
MAANSWDPSSFVFSFSFSFFLYFSRTGLRASCEIYREGWMYGWQARPCMNFHGMYRWFGMVPQGGEVLFPSFFVVIFGALCCAFLGRVMSMISWGFSWVSRMRILCLFGW